MSFTGSLSLCSASHEEICYSCRECPVCEAIEDHNSEVKDLKADIKSLEWEIDKLTTEYDSFTNKCVCGKLAGDR